MKTKEFIKEVEELGFETLCGYDYTSARNENGEILAYVSEGHRGSMDIHFPKTLDLDELTRMKLGRIVFEYAKTPIDEREEEKEFYLKHRWLRCLGGCALLHESTRFHKFVLMGGFGEVPKDYKMKFTQKEIDEIKEKFNTDLSDFEMIEVKE